MFNCLSWCANSEALNYSSLEASVENSMCESFNCGICENCNNDSNHICGPNETSLNVDNMIDFILANNNYNLDPYLDVKKDLVTNILDITYYKSFIETCSDGKQLNCQGICTSSMNLYNTTCNQEFNCEEFEFDNNNCLNSSTIDLNINESITLETQYSDYQYNFTDDELYFLGTNSETIYNPQLFKITINSDNKYFFIIYNYKFCFI